MAEKSTDKPAEKEVADLSKYDELSKNQEKGLEVEIMDPSGRKTGIVIRVAGPDSDRQKKAIEKLQQERLDSGSIAPLTASDVAQRHVRGVAMATIGWNQFKLDGGVYNFTEESAVSLYNRFPWIREQVEVKAGSRAAFMKLSENDAKPLSEDGSKG